MNKRPCEEAQDDEVRKGPWTMEEDLILINYIAIHGEGVWNSLAKSAGLKRTGKSCRLRWLNYLRPDVRRGNITTEEQLLIMDLHAKWGNRWSKIAKHLPGRTDNEIKNYWRTRIQKHIKQAENLQGQCSSSGFTIDMNDQASMISNDQLSSIAELSMQTYNDQLSYTADSSMETYNSPPSSGGRNIETFPAPLSATTEPNDTYWSMEEFWSMQRLFNGD